MYRIRYTFLGCVEVFGWWTAGRADPSTRPFSNGLRRRKTVETLKGNHRLHASSPSSLFTELEAPPTEFLNSFSASYPNLESCPQLRAAACGRLLLCLLACVIRKVHKEGISTVFEPFFQGIFVIRGIFFRTKFQFSFATTTSFANPSLLGTLHDRHLSPPSTNLHQQLALQSLHNALQAPSHSLLVRSDTPFQQY
jgi:hypothetical protein